MQAERTIDNLLPESVGVVTPADIVVLGKIVGPYGLRGAVKVHPFADDPSHWARLPYWWIGQEGSAPGLWRQTRLLKCNLRGDLLVAELDCLPDRADLPPAAKGEYYWADLIGLDVINTRGTVLGQVLGLIETPANDVLRVGDGVKVEQLLPFVATVVLDVDVASRKVCVDWESDW